MDLKSSPPQRLFSPEEAARIAQAKRPAVIMHAPTRFVTEPVAEQSVAAVLAQNPDARPTILWSDPNAEPTEFLGYPAAQLREASPDDYDLAVVAVTHSPELFYSFLTASPLRYLPAVVPGLPGKDHRLLLRQAVAQALPASGPMRALEFGCIEGVHGGTFTTLGLAESLRPGDELVSVDHNPYSIEIARHYCRGLQPVTFVNTDLFTIPQRDDVRGPFHLFYHTIWTSLDRNRDTFDRIYDIARPMLTEPHVFILLHGLTDRAEPGNYLDYLVSLGYSIFDSILELKDPVARYVVALRWDAPRGESNE